MNDVHLCEPVMADKSFLALNERKLKSSVYRIERKAGCDSVVENTIGENWNKSILFCKEDVACCRTHTIVAATN